MAEERLHSIIHLVEKEIGLKPNFVNHSIWEWVIGERMKACQISSYSKYLSLLKASIYEMKKVIELIVIPETWFFREKGSFEFLTSYVKNTWLHQTNKESIRILSIACSSGEEPYSIGMTLLDLGLSKFHIEIDAADISSKSIEKAQKGIYGKNSFRKNGETFIAKYFDKRGEDLVIRNQVKELVNFYCLNILSNHIPFSKNSYHFVFCRNLLIYLDEKSQSATLQLIKKLLKPEGYLIVGPAEAQLATNAGFIPESRFNAYAFSLNTVSEYAPPRRLVASKDELEQLMNEMSHFRDQVNVVNHVPKEENDQNNHHEKSELIKEATIMANNGNYNQAIQLCHTYLFKYGINGEVFFLLGLIQHSRGLEEEAELYFRKVIYLIPKHYEALVYLGLLAEKENNFTKAQRFFERAQKLKT